ncbi:hypothetical protein NDU88_002748 [Pleurodeles waltl]|uniref:Transmembrane protein 92 n=1 Tax=Pleurodeles waltl TaxID=8319 RepID=A0AAV7QA90_PLEWA|nr:hypothetical protein NDU88_002748 [Pleurodeles waltl]
MVHLGAFRSTSRHTTKLLLVGILGGCRTAALHCGIFECTGDYCCGGQCCVRDQVYLDSSWYGPLFISVMVAFAFMCLCGLCNRLCRSNAERHTNNVESGRPLEAPVSPTNSGALAVPITPQQEIYGAPPPYSEVTSKPFLYPAPEGQPPAYSSLMIEDANSGEVYIQSAF